MVRNLVIEEPDDSGTSALSSDVSINRVPMVLIFPTSLSEETSELILENISNEKLSIVL